MVKVKARVKNDVHMDLYFNGKCVKRKYLKILKGEELGAFGKKIARGAMEVEMSRDERVVKNSEILTSSY